MLAHINELLYNEMMKREWLKNESQVVSTFSLSCNLFRQLQM